MPSPTFAHSSGIGVMADAMRGGTQVIVQGALTNCGNSAGCAIPHRSPRHGDLRLDQHGRKVISIAGWCSTEGRIAPPYNTRVICGSTSAASVHSDESDTPIRRTPFRIGN